MVRLQPLTGASLWGRWRNNRRLWTFASTDTKPRQVLNHTGYTCTGRRSFLFLFNGIFNSQWRKTYTGRIHADLRRGHWRVRRSSRGRRKNFFLMMDLFVDRHDWRLVGNSCLWCRTTGKVAITIERIKFKDLITRSFLVTICRDVCILGCNPCNWYIGTSLILQRLLRIVPP